MLAAEAAAPNPSIMLVRKQVKRQIITFMAALILTGVYAVLVFVSPHASASAGLPERSSVTAAQR
jgi:hypothetical protein